MRNPAGLPRCDRLCGRPAAPTAIRRPVMRGQPESVRRTQIGPARPLMRAARLACARYGSVGGEVSVRRDRRPPPGSAPSPTVQRIARRASCGPSRSPIAFRHASGCATAYANRTTGRRQTSRKKGSGSHRWSRPSIRTPDNDSVGAAIFQAGRRAQFRHPATGYACTTMALTSGYALRATGYACTTHWSRMDLVVPRRVPRPRRQANATVTCNETAPAESEASGGTDRFYMTRKPPWPLYRTVPTVSDT